MVAAVCDFIQPDGHPQPRRDLSRTFRPQIASLTEDAFHRGNSALQRDTVLRQNFARHQNRPAHAVIQCSHSIERNVDGETAGAVNATPRNADEINRRSVYEAMASSSREKNREQQQRKSLPVKDLAIIAFLGNGAPATAPTGTRPSRSSIRRFLATIQAATLLGAFTTVTSSARAETEVPKCALPNVRASIVHAATAEPSPIAVQQGIRGTVNVVVWLDSRSAVVRAAVQSSPSSLLNASALHAAQNSIYRTAVANCVPVASVVLFRTTFANPYLP